MRSRNFMAAFLTLMMVILSYGGSTAASSVAERTLLLDDFTGLWKWSQSDWADADKDPEGTQYVPTTVEGVGPGGEPALVAQLHFKPGGYSQGILEHARGGDWTGQDHLSVRIKLVDEDVPFDVRAKLVIFPEGRWTGAVDSLDVSLTPGEWVTLSVPLDVENASANWAERLRPNDLAKVDSWAIKFYAGPVPHMSQPLQVVIAQPTLTDVVQVPDYWAHEGVAGLLRRAVEGAGQVTIEPEATVSRAELVSAVAALLGLEAAEYVTVSSDISVVRAPHLYLSDVTEDDWYYGALQATAQAGILTSVVLHQDRFDGDQAATVADAATLLVRAREFRTGVLLDYPSDALPRTASDYVRALWPEQHGVASADAPLTWANLLELVEGAFDSVSTYDMFRALPALPRYLFHGTEAYIPDQKYTSVGTFGMWSRTGTDARAKGWLGNEHHRGLSAFSWKPLGTGDQLFWEAFNTDASNLILGEISLPGQVVKREYTVLNAATARWDVTMRDFIDDLNTTVYLSRMVPAVLYVTDSPELGWRIDNQSFTLKRLAYKGTDGSVHTVTLPETGRWQMDGTELGAPWIVLFQELTETRDLIPVLIRLEKVPQRLYAMRNSGFDLWYNEAAGALSFMALYGIDRVRGAETSQWERGLPESAVSHVEFWSSALAAFPVGFNEVYQADEAAGYVRVESAFDYYETRDAWGTEPLHLAPVPPVTALAEATGYPIVWRSDVQHSETSTFFGPFAYNRGTSVAYDLPIYAAMDQVYTPAKVTGDAQLEALQHGALGHVHERFYRRPAPSINSTLLASHAQTYSLLDDPQAKDWYREQIAGTLAEFYDERHLDTVFQPASGQSYVYNNLIWCAGEDFDREYYNGRQLVNTAQVAHWLGIDMVAPYWHAMRGLYAYYQIHWDWAWQGPTTFQTGFSYQADGAVLSWEGMMSMARMARMMGDEAILNDALYRSAALGATMYALWELTDWIMERDIVVMHGAGTGEPTRRRPPEEILTGFLPDAFSEFVGVVSTMSTEWGASNWIHDELMGRTRFYNDWRFAELYHWELIRVPELYPVIYDGYNNGSHLHIRSLLFGKDVGLTQAIESVGLDTRQGASGMPYYRVLLRSLVPQVWVSASTARVSENLWDAAASRLTTRMDVLNDGVVTYDWSWRAIERVNPERPEPDAGALPGSVLVNGQPIVPESIQGGFWRVTIPASAGQSLHVEVQY